MVISLKYNIGKITDQQLSDEVFRHLVNYRDTHDGCIVDQFGVFNIISFLNDYLEIEIISNAICIRGAGNIFITNDKIRVENLVDDCYKTYSYEDVDLALFEITMGNKNETPY